MNTRLLVFAASLSMSLGLTAAFVMPASAASTTTPQSKTDNEPQYFCNLKGCYPVHKKADTHKRDSKDQSGSGAGSGASSHHGTPPHP